MKSFQVLERHQNIHKNYLLEASAGTGKTFSIENIIVRLLIEKEPLTLDQILVVTFTKAATKDLLLRVHRNLLNVIYLLKNPSCGPCFDYISKIIEEGEDSVKKAKQRLERALACFDSAQIFTIHSFCARMLSEHGFECHMNLKMSASQEPINPLTLKNVIRDYFRSGKINKNYSPAELKLLLKKFSGDIDQLQNKLFEVISQGIQIEPKVSFKVLLQEFNETLTTLKKNEHFTSEKLFSDFMTLSPSYKEIYDIKKMMKPDISKKIQDFVALFDKEQWNEQDLNPLIEDELSLLEIFSDANKKTKAPSKDSLSLYFPSLIETLGAYLKKYVTVGEIFSRMAYECKHLVSHYKQEKESLSYDDFLLSMRKALDFPEFFSKIRTKYKAAIIDEFQDTDPIQWEIFEKLFVDNPQTLLYLVGDPKQSIYAFRQADIYTYLEAAKKIGTENHASLDTNFRSHAPLVNALNAILTEEASPGLLTLPKRQFETLTLPKVLSAEKNASLEFSDGKGAIHFFIAEDLKARTFPLEELESNTLFPFITHEILELNEKQNFSLNEIAILVSDRYQGQRLSQFLQKWHIPSFLQRSSLLIETEAFLALRELLSAVLRPKDEGRLNIALGGKIIRFNHLEIAALENHDVLKKFYFLQEQWQENGFAAFFETLLKTEWKKNSSVIERLLKEQGGDVFLDDLEQIRDILLSQECQESCSPEGLLKYLDDMRLFPEKYEEILKKIQDPSRKGVRILTIHASKGLEFEIVFALGLIKRTRNQETLIPVESEGKRYLKNIADTKDPHLQSFYAELDAEKTRQLYVAMTRAKYRLYNPIIYAPCCQLSLEGTASPIDLFLAKFGQPPTSSSNIYEKINSYEIRTFTEYADSLKEKGISLSYSILNDLLLTLSPYTEKRKASLKEPKKIIIPGTKRFVQSFTSLSTSSLKSAENYLANTPHDYDLVEKTIHTLPAGNQTGNLLHNCLEILIFEECQEMQKPQDLNEKMLPLLTATPFESWLEVICELVFNAVKKPFIDGFSLDQVSSQNCCKESEFLYRSFLESNPGYLKGFIDLFFFHQGKYYLLDWKSNWLGNDANSYTKEHLHRAMEANHYFLQAKLYKEALKKYLKLLDKRPFEEIFGGIYYIFLRGLSENGGVYHFL